MPSVLVRACLVTGSALVLSGLVYGVIWLVQGGSLDGPTSLRKPILFGISTGLTLLSMAWVLSGLPSRRYDRPLYTGMAVALVVEVAIIDFQQARGVASHFNHATTFDSFLTQAMVVLIGVAVIAFTDAGIRLFQTTRFPPDEAFAARAGAVLLLVACLLGAGITVIGEAQQASGMSPETYGGGGILKFSHGLPIHAIQLLYLQVHLLRRLGVPSSGRLASLRLVTAGILFITVYGVVQTAAGAPRLPPVPVSWPWALLAVVAFASAALRAVGSIQLPKAQGRGT